MASNGSVPGKVIIGNPHVNYKVALHYKHFAFEMIGTFMNIGGEVSIGTLIIQRCQVFPPDRNLLQSALHRDCYVV